MSKEDHIKKKWLHNEAASLLFTANRPFQEHQLKNEKPKKKKKKEILTISKTYYGRRNDATGSKMLGPCSFLLLSSLLPDTL
jgi:hypothetical protein